MPSRLPPGLPIARRVASVALALLVMAVPGKPLSSADQGVHEVIFQPDPWATVGQAVQYCVAMEEQYHRRQRQQRTEPRLRIVPHPESAEGEPSHSYTPADEYLCEVSFRQRLEDYDHSRYSHLILLSFSFFTDEALDTWGTIAAEVGGSFCEATVDSPIYGLVALEFPDGTVEGTNCETGEVQQIVELQLPEGEVESF